MQEAERIPNLLERVDLARFQLKELKHFDEFQHKSLGYSTKSLGKTFQVAYNVTFNFDMLVTHLEVELNSRDNFGLVFEMGEIEASCLTNRGIFSPVIKSSSLKGPSQSKNLIIPAVTITQTLKIALLLKKQFASVFELNFKKQRSRTATEQNVLKIITHVIKSINICGYYLNMNTSASQLVTLLNVSQSFKQSMRLDEAAEVDILVSLCLISARRFVQASELLKKVSRFYVDKYITSKSSMEFSKIDRSWIKEDQRDNSEISGITRSFAAGRVLDGGKYLYKAAKIELLLAETINQPSLLSDKLQAYHRANSYANGNINPTKIQARVDYEETVYTIGSSIMPFLVKMLNDKSEILKISSLKSIEFFYQNLGCTLSTVLPLILKNLIAIYPIQKQREQSRYKTQQNQGQRNQLSNRTKLILDHINHLLQSLLGLLPAMNKKYLKVIFQDIIIHSLSDQYRNQLRLYLLRFGQRILQICGPDLEIPIAYIRHVMTISEGKYNLKTEMSNKHINHNLTYFAQRIIDMLKSKILKNYRKSAPLKDICNWIHETLINLCQNQAIPVNTQLTLILEMVISIYGNTKIPLINPVQPVIYLLNTSLHQAKMPFDKILEAFIVLIAYGDLSEGSFGLGAEIIERIMSRSKISTLSLKELKILQKVLEVQKTANIKWLQQFLDCIPHSNFDEIYSVFDLLVRKCVKSLDKPILSLVINTLFNQYTVKGKAHQHSKQQLITCLIQQPKLSFNIFLQLCLFENHEARPERYYSKNTTKAQHCFDTKLFKLHSELFIQKLNLLLLILNKNDLILPKFTAVLTNDTLVKIHECIQALLLRSNSFKVKSKMLVLLKQLIMIITSIQHKQKKTKEKVLFFKIAMQNLKAFISQYKQSKLHYYTVLNVGLAIEMLQNISSQQVKDPLEFQFMNQEINAEFSVPDNIEAHTHQLCVAEVVGMWPGLVALFHSPWENVREILMLVILNSFKQGLSSLSAKLKQRATECLKQLLLAFLQSNDYTQRLMGVKIFAVVLGLARKLNNRQELLQYIGCNWRFFKPFLQIILTLQQDWHEQIISVSRMITKVCLSHPTRESLCKKLNLERRGGNLLDSSIFSLNLQEELNFSQRKNNASFHDNFQNILKIDEQLKFQEEFQMPELSEEVCQEITGFCRSIEKIGYFNIDSMPEKDSFAEDQQQYFDPNDQKHSQKEASRSEDEQLEFQDLGIIELDDEEWGQEESEMKITQKLPLKKVYKLSPNLGASNKHHRIRNKRYHHSEFQEDKIIVDELEGRINYPHAQQKTEPVREISKQEEYVETEQVKVQEVSESAESQPRQPKKQKKPVNKKRKHSVK